MFTEAEKTAIRRYCGYPMFGNTPNQAFGHRFMTHYGTLEYRMNHASDTEEAVVRDTYLANLVTLETDIPATRTNMDTAAAAVWTRNARELTDRKALYNHWRRELCGFFGVPEGPSLNSSSGNIGIRV